jgi:ubiquinone/menaquinone biosynthesis C-methylase UbiE
MGRDRDAIVRQAFTRQARGFASSPLQRDPERLRRLLAFVAPRAGENALDVACGPGIVTAALAGAGLRAFGIDLTPAMLREAAGGGGSYVQGSVFDLPFREGVFDLVTCRNSLHHLDDPEAAVRAMARVLRGGGRMIIEDLRAPDDPDKREYLETIERLRDVSHARMLAPGEFRALASAAGLQAAGEEPISFVIDFDEWFDRGFAAASNRERAHAMVLACLEEDRCGLKVWREGVLLKFERRSLLFRARKP